MARARKPSKTLRSPEHRALCALLVTARRKAGLNQIELAERLSKPQSFVAKYEGGERRLDVVEFLAVSRAIGADPQRLLRDLIKETA
jgi:transcriptional regulator with XRE-family HTH domain